MSHASFTESLSENAVSKVDKGRYSEYVVACWLKSKGYSIVERNFSCRYGEVDIIALRSDSLYLVEVRSSFRKGAYPSCDVVLDRLLSSITPHKRAKVIAAGYYFLNSSRGRSLGDLDLNVMVVALVWKGKQKCMVRRLLC